MGVSPKRPGRDRRATLLGRQRPDGLDLGFRGLGFRRLGFSVQGKSPLGFMGLWVLSALLSICVRALGVSYG